MGGKCKTKLIVKKLLSVNDQNSRIEPPINFTTIWYNNIIVALENPVNLIV
jgi:hypothetical protein